MGQGERERKREGYATGFRVHWELTPVTLFVPRRRRGWGNKYKTVMEIKGKRSELCVENIAQMSGNVTRASVVKGMCSKDCQPSDINWCPQAQQWGNIHYSEVFFFFWRSTLCTDKPFTLPPRQELIWGCSRAALKCNEMTLNSRNTAVSLRKGKMGAKG